MWTSSDDSVTNGVGWKGSSGEVSGVRRTPRLVVEAALIREVGLLVGGKEGNSSNNTGVLMETPRLVLRLFGCLLDDEEIEIEGYGVDSGDQMEVPSIVVVNGEASTCLV